VLTDPRVQRIPLVLETPSFELPETVWKTEIRVLNQLSGIESEDGEGLLGEEALQEMVTDVREAVQDAEKASGKMGKKGTTRMEGRSTKKPVDVEDDDEDEDEED
jgi:AP endonuclease 1